MDYTIQNPTNPEDGTYGVISINCLGSEARFKITGAIVKDGKAISYHCYPVNELAVKIERSMYEYRN